MRQPCTYTWKLSRAVKSYVKAVMVYRSHVAQEFYRRDTSGFLGESRDERARNISCTRMWSAGLPRSSFLSTPSALARSFFTWLLIDEDALS